MADLGIPSHTIAVLKKYKFSIQKKYGQNFLTDRNILEKIIAASQITKEDCILEIGPGIGTLTQYLAQAAGKVIAVEIDRKLIPVLEETLSGYDNITLRNEDILKTDIRRLVQEQNAGKPIKVVANLPYYITTPIIMSLFEQKIPLKGIIVMVQREVADRMQAAPGTKEYGALSLAVQYYVKPEIVACVPPECFIPRPHVGSAVVRLIGHEKPQAEVEEERFLFALIRASFNQRRKTLVNGLTHAENLNLTREQVTTALQTMNLSETIRGEALTLPQFMQLAGILSGRFR